MFLATCLNLHAFREHCKKVIRVWEFYLFLRVAVTKYPNLGGLKQQMFIVSYF